MKHKKITVVLLLAITFCLVYANPVFAKPQNQTIVKKIGNDWDCTKNGHILYNYTGFADNQYGTWYCHNGKVDFNANGVLPGTYYNQSKWGLVSGGKLQKQETVAKNQHGWWYISSNGFVNFSANTVAKNKNGWWIIQNGKVNFNYTGFADNKNGTWYCRNGKVDFNTYTVLRGTYHNQSKWGFVSGGKLQKQQTVAKNGNGWWFIQNGKVNFNYTGFADNQNGTWYCRYGKVDFNASGALHGTYANQSKWGFVRNGKLQKSETIEKNSYGWWFIDNNGFVDFSANKLAKNANGWWFIQNGKVNFNYNGLAKNQNGTWYCHNGKVDYAANTVVEEKNGSWLVQNGQVTYNYTGLIQLNDKYYQISKGSVIQEITPDSKPILKPYYQEEMQKTIDTVKSLQTEPTLIFPLYVCYSGS